MSNGLWLSLFFLTDLSLGGFFFEWTCCLYTLIWPFPFKGYVPRELEIFFQFEFIIDYSHWACSTLKELESSGWWLVEDLVVLVTFWEQVLKNSLDLLKLRLIWCKKSSFRTSGRNMNSMDFMEKILNQILGFK